MCGVYTDCERPPTILHGRTKLSIDDEGINVFAIYSCESGYQLDGLSQIYCDTSTDEWEGDLPACKLGEYKKKSIIFNLFFLFLIDLHINR